jgi:hypothetical protein
LVSKIKKRTENGILYLLNFTRENLQMNCWCDVSFAVVLLSGGSKVNSLSQLSSSGIPSYSNESK